MKRHGFCIGLLALMFQIVFNQASLYLRTSLHKAVVEENIKEVKILLDNKTDVDVKDIFGDTPLHMATKLENVPIAKLLLEYGANVNSTNNAKYSPLHLAVFSMREFETLNITERKNKLDMIRVLLESEAYVNSVNMDGETPLHLASYSGDADVVKMLLSYGAEINASDLNDLLPLHLAVNSGSLSIVEILLMNGSDTDSKEKRQGDTALHLAARNGNANMTRLMIAYGANIRTTNKQGETPLHVASKHAGCEEDHSESDCINAVKILLMNGSDVNARDKFGCTLLHLAAYRGNIGIAKLLVEQDAVIDGRCRIGNSPFLHVALNNTLVMDVLEMAIGVNETQIVKYLLDSGADVNDTDLLQSTALHVAAKKGQSQIVLLLIEKGADPNALDAEGRTPFYYGLSSNKTEIVRILIDNRSGIFAEGRHRMTSLHLAAKSGNLEIVKMLLENGADIYALDEKKHMPFHYAIDSGNTELVKSLIGNKTNINLMDIYGCTPLHWAAYIGDLEIARHFVMLGADVNAECSDGRTPLHATIGDKIEHKTNPNMIEFLLSSGAKVDASDDFGSTALHMAAEKGRTVAVEVLLKNNANTTALDINEFTPLHCAVLYSNVDVVSLFQDYKVDINAEFRFSTSKNTRIKRMLHELKKFNDYIKLINLFHKDTSKQQPKGLSPLALAVWIGHKYLFDQMIKVANTKHVLNPSGLEWPPLHTAAFSGSIDFLKHLIESGADVNSKDRYNMTALHRGVMKGDVEIVKALLESNSDVNAAAIFGLSPLHTAARHQSLPLSKLLIDANADVSREDVAGFTPLMYAEAGGHPVFLKLLFDKNLDLNSTNRYNYLHILFGSEWNVLLWFPINLKTIYYFDLEDHITVDFTYSTEDIDFAVRKAYNSSAKIFDLFKSKIHSRYGFLKEQHRQLLTLLVENTKDLDKQDNVMGWSALHWAAATGDIDLVKLLVSKGARLSLKSNLYQSPMFLARYWGHRNVFEYFKTIGAVW